MLTSYASLAVAAFASLAVAQTAPAGTVKTHVINVGRTPASGGGVGLTFEPDTVQAAIGDHVQFQFWVGNHSVVQSNFDSPCQPLPQTTGANATAGFSSGFMPVTTNSTSMPTFDITVNNSGPIWFYCSQGRHCQNGMSGVINPPANNANRTLNAYKQRAQSVQQAGNPTTTGGGSTPTGGSSPNGSGAPTPTPTGNRGSGAAGLAASSTFAFLVAAALGAALL